MIDFVIVFDGSYYHNIGENGKVVMIRVESEIPEPKKLWGIIKNENLKKLFILCLKGNFTERRGDRKRHLPFTIHSLDGHSGQS